MNRDTDMLNLLKPAAARRRAGGREWPARGSNTCAGGNYSLAPFLADAGAFFAEAGAAGSSAALPFLADAAAAGWAASFFADAGVAGGAAFFAEASAAGFFAEAAAAAPSPVFFALALGVAAASVARFFCAGVLAVESCAGRFLLSSLFASVCLSELVPGLVSVGPFTYHVELPSS
jgi:hypothetical protein